MGLLLGLLPPPVGGEVQTQSTTTATGAPAPGLSLLEAVLLTLREDPNIALSESRLAGTRGALRSAQGAFDPLLRTSLNRTDTTFTTGGEGVNSSVDLTQKLRSGLSLTPSLELERQEDEAGIANLGTLTLTLRQPLLRGRGRDVVAAGEASAERQVQAAQLDLAHTISSRLRAVIARYWAYRAAALNLEIFSTSEESTRSLLETTRRLIAADVTPAAELVQLEADLASKESSRIAGERALYAARQALGQEIGLSADGILELPLATDFFPAVDPASLPAADTLAATLLWRREALARRSDLQAERERLAAAEISLRAADNAQKPQLDLTLSPRYSGSTEGHGLGDFFTPLWQNVPGLSATFGVSLAWPLRNRSAEGDFLRAQAARDQQALRLEQVTREIGATVPTALDAVRQNARQVEKAALAIRLFEKAVDNEEKKLRAGSSTLIDVTTQRDRLTAARQQLVATQLSLAQAIAELRFQTGTLLPPQPDAPDAQTLQLVVRPEQFTTLPESEVLP